MACAIGGKPDGRAAIQRTELLCCNEALDIVACDGEPSSPREIINSRGFASHPTGSLFIRAIQNLSYAQ